MDGAGCCRQGPGGKRGGLPTTSTTSTTSQAALLCTATLVLACSDFTTATYYFLYLRRDGVPGGLLLCANRRRSTQVGSKLESPSPSTWITKVGTLQHCCVGRVRRIVMMRISIYHTDTEATGQNERE